MNNLKILLKSTQYQILIYFRIKEAVFFSTVFPVFLFVVFGNIWGAEPEYVPFLLSGVIGMTISSDGLFATGPVIKEYYNNGLIKYFRKLPFNILLHFGGLIISRLLSLLITIVVLAITAFFVFQYKLELKDFLSYTQGLIVGLIIFSFIGLCLAFSGLKGGGSGNKGLGNFLYFVIIFTSSVFYDIHLLNPTIGFIGNLLPLNPILHILRGEQLSILPLLFWLVAPICLFFILFKNIKTDR